MKILILQLARLGDIYQSWPALRGLRRLHPEAEIHVLTRPRFAEAWNGLEAVDRIHQLPTAEILQAAIEEEWREGSLLDHPALQRIAREIDTLRKENFDQVINLTFSPLSSYLTHALAGREARVTGYTRFADGYLNLPDDMSAYFYAQVGYDRPNRFHLCEIFGTLCEVDLLPEDWRAPELPEPPADLPTEYICAHIGASEAHKAISVSKWISILSQIRKLRPIPVVLIGAPSERTRAEQIESGAPGGEVIHRAGKTSLLETMTILKNARLLIGPDSAPVHMAAFVGCPVLNLSLGRVKFWETGPRSAGSVVLPAESEDDLPSDVVADYVFRMLHNQRLPFGTIESSPGAPSFTGGASSESEFEWRLLKAIYLGGEFPVPKDPLFFEAIKQLNEVNRFMLDHLDALKSPKDLPKRAGLLERGEEIIETVAKLVPSVIPIVRWYKTEKVRIGPESFDVIRRRNLEIQRLFQGLIEVYCPESLPPPPSPESEAS